MEIALHKYIIIIIVAIAEVYKNEGNDEYKKINFNRAIHYYTKGIKVNCKDEELNAKLYSNRAAANLNLGKKLKLVFIVVKYFESYFQDGFVSILLSFVFVLLSVSRLVLICPHNCFTV